MKDGTETAIVIENGLEDWVDSKQLEEVWIYKKSSSTRIAFLNYSVGVLKLT